MPASPAAGGSKHQESRVALSQTELCPLAQWGFGFGLTYEDGVFSSKKGPHAEESGNSTDTYWGLYTPNAQLVTVNPAETKSSENVICCRTFGILWKKGAWWAHRLWPILLPPLLPSHPWPPRGEGSPSQLMLRCHLAAPLPCKHTPSEHAPLEHSVQPCKLLGLLLFFKNTAKSIWRGRLVRCAFVDTGKQCINWRKKKPYDKANKTSHTMKYLLRNKGGFFLQL